MRTITNNTLEALSWIELFHGDLQAGNHTLVINITEISSPQAIGIDAILYNASFPNLAALPGYSSTSTPPAWSNRTSVNGVIAGCVVGGVALISIFRMISGQFGKITSCPTRRAPRYEGFTVGLTPVHTTWNCGELWCRFCLAPKHAI
ncbi:hypothetical protein BD779DRAFT_1499935 [Infundibulicybe gibba]|nr:hypothetical protein BD779DRAFT_1499935 [Infundibulicybe gibba]